MLRIDMVHAVVVVHHQRRDYLVDGGDLFLRDPDDRSGLGEDLRVLVVGDGGFIPILPFPASCLPVAAVADVWRSVRQFALSLERPLHESVVEDLLGDCGAVLVDSGSDPREWVPIVEELLDDASVLERKMLVLQCCHSSTSRPGRLVAWNDNNPLRLSQGNFPKGLKPGT